MMTNMECENDFLRKNIHKKVTFIYKPFEVNVSEQRKSKKIPI